MSQSPEGSIPSLIVDKSNRYLVHDLFSLLEQEGMETGGIDLRVQVQIQGNQDFVSARLVKKPNGQFEVRDENNQVMSLGHEDVIFLDSDAELFLGIKNRESKAVDLGRKAEVRGAIFSALARASDGVTAGDAAALFGVLVDAGVKAEVESLTPEITPSLSHQNGMDHLLLDQKEFREDECLYGGPVSDILNQIAVNNKDDANIATKALLIDSLGGKTPVVIAKPATSKNIQVRELTLTDNGKQTIGNSISYQQDDRIYLTEHDQRRLRIIRTRFRQA